MERTAVGSPQDWAAKDLLAHVTTWRERGAEELEAARHGPLPPESQEFDEANRVIFEQNRDQPWEVLLRRAKESWQAYSTHLGRLNEAELLAGGTEAQPGRPLWRRITVDAGNHPMLHYAEFSRLHGRADSGTRWMASLTPLLLAVDPSSEWHGVVHYNLACHFALSGHPEPALESLRQSLELNPGLRQWSRQDADLASLHNNPIFIDLAGAGE
jgi:hypothetical protein